MKKNESEYKHQISESAVIKLLGEAENNETVVFSKTAMAAAAALIRDEQEQRDIARARQRMLAAQNETDARVARLRTIRQAERLERRRLDEAIAAQAAFVKTGDWTAYEKAIRNIQ